MFRLDGFFFEKPEGLKHRTGLKKNHSLTMGELPSIELFEITYPSIHYNYV